MQVNASQFYSVPYTQQAQSAQTAQAPQGGETGRAQGHHRHHHHDGGGLGAMVNGGAQGVADVKSQLSQMVQDLKSGKITDDQFKQEMTNLANKDLKSDLSATDKAKAIHTLARMANMESRMQDLQPGQTQPQSDALSQLLRSWAGSYAQSQGVTLGATAAAAPQGALLDGKA